MWSSVMRTVAGPAALEEAHAALERLWCTHRLPDAVRMNMAIAVSEIMANILEHGSAGRNLVQIEMQIDIQPGRVMIVLIDDGNEPNVDFDGVRMPHDLAEDGRGLAIARLALESLVYQRHPDGNHWLMTSKAF